MRIILYTGKGGVGKTSVAAATACNIAAKGKKVMIMSTDQAHSLSDSFDIKLGNEPTTIVDNLWGMEIDTVVENEKAWGNLKDYIKSLMVLKSKETIEVEELLVFPGFEELLSLIKIKEIYNEGNYDVLVVDCAPTGETMSLLKFPELFKGFMEKVFPIKKKSAKIIKPIIEPTLKISMPNDEAFEDIEKLYSNIDELHSLMLNKDVVSIRIVTTAENIVIKEAKRSFSYLHLFDYNVDAVIINKIFPKKSIEGYFKAWDEIQKNSIRDIEESFVDIPIFKLELLNIELRGYSVLNSIGNRLYEIINSEEVLFREKIFNIKKDEGKYVFSINMPFVNKEQLDLVQNGDEITITIKNEKRRIILPANLQSKDIVGAKYKDNCLNIIFQ